jgi:hypothetical protein
LAGVSGFLVVCGEPGGCAAETLAPEAAVKRQGAPPVPEANLACAIMRAILGSRPVASPPCPAARAKRSSAPKSVRHRGFAVATGLRPGLAVVIREFNSDLARMVLVRGFATARLLQKRGAPGWLQTRGSACGH